MIKQLKDLWKKGYIAYYEDQYGVHYLKKEIVIILRDLYNYKKKYKLKRAYLTEAIDLFVAKYNNDTYRFIVDFKKWFDYIYENEVFDSNTKEHTIPQSKQLEEVVAKWIKKIKE